MRDRPLGLKGINEKQLFHGSHANNIPVILKDGFDHRVANMGGAMGAGVYFSPNSSYRSNQFFRNPRLFN